ncbi:histone deacetylase [Methanolobus sp. ZRKC5]|uniref:histone deacetylase family protein n=1 Tax=unclassified Methanolobus TaxID=2629569 RepID=UPI00313DBF32
MSSDNNEAGDSSKNVSTDIMKKLNDAFSSYLDGSESIAKETDTSENDSLLELVRSGIAEKQSHVEEADHEGIDVDIPAKEIVNIECEISVFSEDDEPDNINVNTQVPSVLSGVFDDVQYQSVEIEVNETDDTAEDEGESHYLEVVSDILKKTPKGFNPSFSMVENTSSSDTPLHVHDKPGLNESELKLSKISGSEKAVLSAAITKKLQEQPVKPKLESEEPQVKNNDAGIVSSSPVPSFTISFEPKETTIIGKSKVQQPKSASPISSSSGISENVKAHRVSEKPKENVPDNPTTIAFLYNKDHRSHDAASLSINTHEKPERLIKAMWYLEKNKVFEDGTCTFIDKFEMADESDLLRVHDESYISFVRSYASAGGGFLGDSTYMTSTSYDIAKMAAGAAMKAGDLLMDNKFSHAFVLARPPGHHASSQKYGGFCLFNNAAILAKYLQKRRNVGKILILDWDAHAGDGTMEIFYEDPTVMFLSVHRDPHGFYPRKGFSTQTGENAGKGYTLNVEMPEGSGNDEYMLAFDETIVPMISQFAPEIIIFSCGFDAYYREKNIGLMLDSDGYHQMTTKVCSVFSGPMVFLMEGGYHDFNGQLCHSVLSSLHGNPNPVSDRQEISSYKMNQQKQIFAATQKKIEESKKHSPILSLQVS